jgi:hypothetical protein
MLIMMEVATTSRALVNFYQTTCYIILTAVGTRNLTMLEEFALCLVPLPYNSFNVRTLHLNQISDKSYIFLLYQIIAVNNIILGTV